MSHDAHSGAAPLMLSVSGCRGIVGRSLTPDVACRYAGAAASWMRERAPSSGARPRIVVASDGRLGGDVLRYCVAWALAAAGCDVADIGVATTPTVGVMVDHLRAQGGITLTASHNPGEWNGLKAITPDGAAPDPAAAADIISRFRNGSPAFAPPTDFGTVERINGAEDVHVQRVLKALSAVAEIEQIRARRFHVVVDSVNASGAGVARRLLEALGCRLDHLNADDSGVFPHTPEPTPENLAFMGREITSRSAAIGFAQDPDADRLALLDEQGRYIGEEYTLALAALAVLGADPARAKGVTLAANLSTSRMIDDVAARFGATVRRSPVGEANVVAAMRSVGALIGGEGNGGVIWPAVTWIRDSVGAMALTLALMARENAPLSKLVESIPPYAIDKRKAPLPEGGVEGALRATEVLYRNRPGATIDRQDGVRADFPAPSGDGMAWVHVRPSNTEPIVRFIAEAPTARDAGAILDELAEAIARP